MKKLYIFFMMGCLLLCGCENNELGNNGTNNPTNFPVVTIEPTSTPSDNALINDDTTEVDKDAEIEKYFAAAKNKVSTYAANGSQGSVKEIFTIIVDFIFYNGEINGVKFNDLKDTTKTKIVSYALDIDSVIEAKWPGWKDTIKSTSSNMYDGVTSKLKEELSDYDNKLRDTIGADAYDTTKDSLEKQTSGAKDTISEVISEAKDLGSDIINSVKGWYDNLKRNS